MEITKSDYGKDEGIDYYCLVDECSVTTFDKWSLDGYGQFTYISLFLMGNFTGTSIKTGKVEEFIQKFENTKGGNNG